MNPGPVGTLIRVVRNEHRHNYAIGRVYRVVHSDDDGTLRAADETGTAGNWLRWTECEPAGPSTWARIAAELPAELVRFLSCFDGIAEISLKESVIDSILAEVPDLHERVATLAATPTGEALVAGNRPPVAEPQKKPKEVQKS
jgi:hypothetical protein